MSNNRYYLCNDIRFLAGYEESATSPGVGTHMRKSKAVDFVSNHPRYGYYKARSSPKGNDYVICTKMKFVGNDKNVVSDIQLAKSFPTAEEASSYLDANRECIDPDISVIVDEYFRRQKVVILHKTNQKEITYDYMDTSNRITIPAEVRKMIYGKSNGVCEICGKPLSEYSYSIDHIRPLSRGGTNEPSNLRAVHRECNQLKGKFTDDEMFYNIANIASNILYTNPETSLSVVLFRNFVRGIINKYEKGALQN